MRDGLTFQGSTLPRLEGTGVTVNVADPGGASTEMTRSEAMPWSSGPSIPRAEGDDAGERGAVLDLPGFFPEAAGVSGEYFEPPNTRVKSSKASYE